MAGTAAQQHTAIAQALGPALLPWLLTTHCGCRQPLACLPGQLPWAKKSASGNPLETKYPYVCHAEMNAILNKNGASGAPLGLVCRLGAEWQALAGDVPQGGQWLHVHAVQWPLTTLAILVPAVEGAKVFVTMFPCNECAKLMIQVGTAAWLDVLDYVCGCAAAAHTCYSVRLWSWLVGAVLNVEATQPQRGHILLPSDPLDSYPLPSHPLQAGISEIVYHEAKDQPAQSDSPLITSSFK